MVTLSAVLGMFVACTAAPPYDDCGPAFAAARANPDSVLVIEAVEQVFSDPALYEEVFWRLDHDMDEVNDADGR